MERFGECRAGIAVIRNRAPGLKGREQLIDSIRIAPVADHRQDVIDVNYAVLIKVSEASGVIGLGGGAPVGDAGRDEPEYGDQWKSCDECHAHVVRSLQGRVLKSRLCAGRISRRINSPISLKIRVNWGKPGY